MTVINLDGEDGRGGITEGGKEKNCYWGRVCWYSSRLGGGVYGGCGALPQQEYFQQQGVLTSYEGMPNDLHALPFRGGGAVY